MSQLTKVRNLIRRPVRRSRIVRLTNTNFGAKSPITKAIIKAADDTRDLNRGKRRKNGEARISHERDMFVIAMKHVMKTSPSMVDGTIALAIFYHDRWEENARKWPLYRIEQEAGRDVRDITRAVSKPPRMTDSQLVSAEGSRLIAERIRNGDVPAMVVKVIDRFHYFLKPFAKQDRRRLIWKVAQTMLYIQPMALEVGVLAAELEEVVGLCIRRNNITTEELMEFV